jgi:hypothetical protein
MISLFTFATYAKCTHTPSQRFIRAEGLTEKHLELRSTVDHIQQHT